MLLENKTAVIYGGGGAIGSAVAQDFAREGARVFLAGRTLARLDAVAKEIAAGGGRAETAQVNALDERAVERHIEEVTRKTGGIDILFNGIGMEDIQGILLVEIPIADFVHPIVNAATAQFATARPWRGRWLKKVQV
jgi:NAD(P)-dependent dehydrogenase (short-subunit alcohol dehydrogenase family)